MMVAFSIFRAPKDGRSRFVMRYNERRKRCGRFLIQMRCEHGHLYSVDREVDVSHVVSKVCEQHVVVSAIVHVT